MRSLSNILIPLAIIIAGAFIAWGVYNSGRPQAAPTGPSAEELQKKADTYIASLDIAPVTSADHMQGSPDAKVTIIEYSDTECPFCKEFHGAVTQIYNDYNPPAVAAAVATTSKSGGKKATTTVAASAAPAATQVAWVYRHYPIADIHSKAPKEAEATECANQLGGNAVFWKYLGAIFANTPSNDGLDPAQLLTLADQVGLDKNAVAECVNSGKYTAKINESVQAAIKAGADATPYTVILVKSSSGKIERVPLISPTGASLGSIPYDTLKSIVKRLLNS